MLHTFYAYGFRGPIFDSIDDYSKDRMQYVFPDKKRSTLLKITTGVPQGSILATFLFLIYINDLTENAKNSNQIAKFADDISLVKAVKRNECRLHEDLDKMAVWFTSNRLTVNAS